FIVINIYDKGETLRHRLQVRRSGVPHNVEVFVNSAEYTLPLQTHQVSRTEVIYKAPHPMLATHWDQRTEKLRKYIAEQLERLEADAPEPLKGLEDHLFVDARLAKLVRANLDAVRETLNQLDLRLEKLQYAYASQASS
ncbi:MAG: ATPase, partial [Bacteroidota bacterium]